MLDATAGNRMMWPNKNPPLTIFLDKNTELRIPPHIIGDARKLPFRNRIFSTVFFDPPHDYRGPHTKSKYANPRGSYYGQEITRAELLNLIAFGIPEIYRVLKDEGRLCFKWSEERILLYNLLVFFKQFKEVYRKRLNLKAKRRKENPTTAHVRGGGYDSWWITFARVP